jgi:hypothetical protein
MTILALTILIPGFSAELAARRQASARRWPLAVAIVLALVLGPNHAHGWCPQATLFHRKPVPPPQAAKHIIAALRALELREHVVVLEPDFGYAFYAGWDYERVPEWQKDRPFREYLSTHHISVVVDPDALLRHPAFTNDPDLKAFLTRPEDVGFRVVRTAETSAQIALRNDVAARAHLPP